MKNNIFVILIILISISCGQNESKPIAMDIRNPTFFHNVYFYLTPNITEDQRKIFEEGLVKLGTINTIIDYHIARPAMTPRDVVDNSYDYAALTSFKNKADQDAYQIDQIHEDFRQLISGIVDSVRIFDSIKD